MSWDVLVYKLNGARPADPEAAGLLSPGQGVGARCLDLGTPDDVRFAVDHAFTRVDWERPTGGMMVEGDLSISFYYNQDAPRPHLAIQVYGHGDVKPAIARLCLENGWTPVEVDTRSYFDLEAFVRTASRTTKLTGVTGMLPRLATEVLPPLPPPAQRRLVGPMREVTVVGVGLLAAVATGLYMGVSSVHEAAAGLDTSLGVGVVAAGVTAWFVYGWGRKRRANNG